MIRSGYADTPQPEIPKDWEARPLDLARIPAWASQEDRYRWMRERQAAKPEGNLKGRYQTCK